MSHCKELSHHHDEEINLLTLNTADEYEVIKGKELLILSSFNLWWMYKRDSFSTGKLLISID